MSVFVTNSTQVLAVATLTIGTIPSGPTVSGFISPDASPRKVKAVEIVNTHASAPLYVRQNADATSTAFDVAVPGTGRAIINLRQPCRKLSFSGLNTAITAHLNFGSVAE